MTASGSLSKSRPDDFWADVLLGRALRLRNNPSESLRFFQAALAVRPDSSFVYNSLGNSLFDLKRYDEARDAFETGLRLDPRSSANLVNLSWALFYGGHHAEAIPRLRAAIGTRPDDALLHFYLGASLFAVNQKEEALKNFEKCLELDPMIIVNWQQTRMLLLRSGSTNEKVRKFWRQALATNPSKHEAWDGYAELSLFLAQEDEYRWARRELLKRFAATKDPHVAERTGRACLFLPGTDEDPILDKLAKHP